jgi:2,3-dihydroxybenzoate decarboxylase
MIYPNLLHFVLNIRVDLYVETLLYLDEPQYDAFWKVVQELDVPVYLHPKEATPSTSTLSYVHSPWIIGAQHEFAVQLSNHVVGLCANGVLE